MNKQIKTNKIFVQQVIRNRRLGLIYIQTSSRWTEMAIKWTQQYHKVPLSKIKVKLLEGSSKR